MTQYGSITITLLDLKKKHIPAYWMGLKSTYICAKKLLPTLLMHMHLRMMPRHKYCGITIPEQIRDSDLSHLSDKFKNVLLRNDLEGIKHL